MAQPAPKLIHKLWSLDVFRGLCALTVFLSHWQAWSLFPATTEPEKFINTLFSAINTGFNFLTWNTGGHHPAVIAFMVLSGYCIHLARLRSASTNTDHAPNGWRNYLRRRAIRILPTYWVGAILGLLFVFLQTTYPVANRTLDFYAQSSPLDTAVRLVGLATFYPRELLAGNGPLNYVACELIIYLIYPLLFGLMRPRGWAWLFGIGVVAQAAAYLLARSFDPFWAYNTPLMMGLFWLLGARLADAHKQRRRLPALPVLVATLSAFFLVREALPAFPARNLLLQLLWAIACATVISLSVSLEKYQPELGDHPVVRRLRRLGLASFSLYIVHTPALFVSGWILLQLLPAPTYGLQMALGLALTFMFTALSFFLVENPCLGLLSRRIAPPDTPAARPDRAPGPSPVG